MKKFVINLDSCPERMEAFDDTWIRWRATPREEVSEELDKKMVSIWNSPHQNHLAKCGCFWSHLTLLKKIADEKLNDILVVEDDAKQLKEIPVACLREKGFVYLGGFFLNRKVSKGTWKGDHHSVEGINNAKDKPFVMCGMLAYYISNWEVAKEIYDEIVSHKRYRAIDMMLPRLSVDLNYYYPGLFLEKKMGSSIRDNKRNYMTEDYRWRVPAA